MSALAGARSAANRFAAFLLSSSAVETARLLTLLMLLMHGPEGWYARLPLLVLCVIGIAVRAARSAPAFWIAIAMFVLAHDIVSWAEVDNHKWLMGWWCLALALASLAPESQRERVVQTNARLLLGLCFAFATLWKLLSADYLDGTFFEFELLTDSRFADVAHYVGGIRTSDLVENRESREDLQTSYRSDAVQLDSVVLVSSPRTGILAVAMTWWTLAIEGLIALLFLWPGERWISAIRTFSILVFAATTYLVAPVLGFGWIVIVLGFAQCPERHPKLRASFPIVLALLYAYQLKLGSMFQKIADVGIGEMIRFY